MITGVHHISMKCGTEEEFARAKEFYLNTLGFTVKREWTEGIMIDTGNCMLEIFSNGPGIRTKGAIRHIAFGTDDVDNIIRKVKEAGYEVFIEPNDIVIRSEPECPARMAFCFGPLGEEIEFFQEKSMPDRGLDTETGVNESTTVRRQYSTPDKLNTRISIHSKYSTNKQGFGNWITSHYQIREGASVLELGCGTGEMWIGKEDMIHRCSRLVLSDFSEGMLEKAKTTLRGFDGIEYRMIDIQDIPFGDQEFDVVIANMMLYHVPDLSKGLGEVRRVLKEDGTFYCATYSENGMMEYIYSLFRDYGVQNQVNRNFTLQNGEEKLKPFFPEVQRFLYADALKVTKIEDMIDYIYSLTGMTNLQIIPKNEVRAVLESNMQDGVLYVPKEYGLFVAKKQGFTD